MNRKRDILADFIKILGVVLIIVSLVKIIEGRECDEKTPESLQGN